MEGINQNKIMKVLEFKKQRIMVKKSVLNAVMKNAQNLAEPHNTIERLFQ
jgi:hypothetical protein